MSGPHCEGEFEPAPKNLADERALGDPRSSPDLGEEGEVKRSSWRTEAAVLIQRA